MPESATKPLSRREQAARRISTCAQALTDEHGFDGFTMEDLAEAAGVSRRTLFNYFDSKLDAVLGPEPEIDDADIREFCAGGPTGSLFTDLAHFAHSHFERLGHEQFTFALNRQTIRRNSRVLAACHERFEQLAERVLELIREREGEQYDDLRAKVALGSLLVLIQISLETFLESSDQRTFMDHYDDAYAVAQSLIS